MSRKARIWLVAVLVLIIWIALSWFVPLWMGLTGAERMRWIVFGVMALIGTFATLFTAIFLIRRPPAPPAPKDPLSQEVEQALSQSERRLIESKVVKGRALQRMPVIFLIGAKGHQKTSTVVRSQTEAELLAGEVLRDVSVVPTQSINVWLARPALIVEAALDVLNDAQRRARLLHLLQPARLTDAVARGEQAPRAALVCVSTKVFGAAAPAGASLTLARELRTTLSEIAHAYGVQLPVYVLFTEADSIPGFREYARHLSADEVREVLGTSFELPPDLPPSRYTEFATARVQSALGSLIRSLGDRRHVLLKRLGDADDRYGAYAFPRELNRLRDGLRDFLVELTKPSELRVNPFLRGFYFSGVRELIVSEGPAVVAPAAMPTPPMAGATSLLRPLPQPTPGAPVGGGIRREAQWVFLSQLFSKVLLNDPVAFGVTRGGGRVSHFRRLALGAGLGVAAVLLVAVSVSFVRNARLQRRALAQSAALGAVPGEPVRTPSLAQLARLDSLGTTLDVVSSHVHDGAPFSFRWGLSQSGAIYDAVRRRYFAHFASLLFDATQQAAQAKLLALPATALAGAQYQDNYARLKTYLITTDFHDSSTVDYVAPQLLADWPGAAAADTTTLELARRQFERFARELRYADLYRRRSVPAVVTHARDVINMSSGEEPIYQALIADASNREPEFNFNRLNNAGLRTLNVPKSVPGAFTDKGWARVHAGLANIDAYLRREEWVVGSNAPRLTVGRDSLVQLLRARYDGDYADRWRALVTSANVIGFANLSDAAQRLSALSSPNSEYLLLFAWVNQHIPDDSQRVAKYFTPIGTLGQRRPGPVLTTEAMAGYLKALNELAGKTQIAAGVADPVQGKQALLDAKTSAVNVDAAINGMAAPLNRDEWQTLELARLLQQPARYTNALLDRAIRSANASGTAVAAAQAGQEFCEKLGALTSKRPFATAREEVSSSDLAAVFGPNGSLWTLAQGDLGKVVRRRGFAFVPGEIPPTREALGFLNRLATISQALFGSGQAGAQIVVDIAPVAPTTTVSIAFGGKSETWTKGQEDLRSMVWNPATDNSIRITGIASNVININGAWAIKAFFETAKGWAPESGGYLIRDADYGKPFHVRMNRATEQFLRGDLVREGLACPDKWTPSS